MERYEGCTWLSLFPDGGDFPELLKFSNNIDYVREVIKNSVTLTKDRESYIDVSKLAKDSIFAVYNKTVCNNDQHEPAHEVIVAHIKKFNEDYRYETKPHPIGELSSKTHDNTSLARQN